MRGRAFAVNQAIGFGCVPIISFLAFILVPAAPFGIEGWRWVVLIGAFARGRGILAPRPARKPALARQARAARRGGQRAEGHRGQGRGRNRAAPALAGADRADLAREQLHGPVASGHPRPGDSHERLQHLPDDRLLRLLELGSLAPRQAGDHDLDQPRLYDGHCACRAGRAADRLLPRRQVRAQMDHRRGRRRSFSSAGSCSGRRARRRSSSPWASG